MPLAPGETFDRYVIRSALGVGGMGEVYEAYDSRLERPIALKVLRIDMDADDADTAGARLLREARVAAAFDHPHAVAIFDVGEMDGVPFFAMEYIAGRSLRAYIGDPLVDIERRLRWLIDVASALGAAHARGLVHRDIKPENIMIREDGVVKVVDFGIARRSSNVAPPSVDAQRVAHGVVAGTPVYMAPELMLLEPFDGKADQFSWGVVAYELLTGRLPWSGKANTILALGEMLGADPPAPDVLNPQVSTVVSAVVLRALARTAEERFASMDALVVELDPMAAPLPRAARSLPRLPGSDTVTTTTRQVTVEGSVPPPPKPAPERASSSAIVGGALGALATVGAAWLIVHAVQLGATPSQAPVVDSRAPSLPALTAFGSAMAAFHDARLDEAAAELDRAVERDPSFAAAHLRRALLSNQVNAKAREHFKKARQLRDRLSERDLALLEAFQYTMDVQPHPGSTVRALDVVVKRYPDDTEILFFRGKARWFDADWPGASADMDAVLARDPRSAVAWRYKGYSLAFARDFDGARRAYDACRDLLRSATACLRDLAKLDETEGRCQSEERLVRERIELDHGSADARGDLATALYGQHVPDARVFAELETQWKLTDEADRPLAELLNRASWGLLSGEFATADAIARRWTELLPPDADEVEHFQPVELAAFAALEAGSAAKAGQIVEEYLVRRAAWPRNPFEPDFSIEAYATEYRAGSISRALFLEKRTAWLAADERRVTLFARQRPGERWFYAYAFPAQTREDANEALALLPKYQPLATPFLRDTFIDEVVGRVYLLAGRYAEAIPILRRGARSCTAIQSPFFHTWATLELGQALEASGAPEAREEACAAYRVVASRWSSARPRSKSGELAAERLRALGCRADGEPRIANDQISK